MVARKVTLSAVKLMSWIAMAEAFEGGGMRREKRDSLLANISKVSHKWTPLVDNVMQERTY